MSHDYKGPGEYIAICNNSKFNGHYVKRFTVPKECVTMDTTNIRAVWWFMNIEDMSACVEAVYPASIFNEE